MVGGCGLVGGWGLREGSLLLVHGSSECLALRRSQTIARFGDFAVKRRCAGFAVTKKSLRRPGKGGRTDHPVRPGRRAAIRFWRSWVVIDAGFGLWRSLVAHLMGGQGVAGSNPVSPTVWPWLVCAGQGPFSCPDRFPSRPP